MLPTTHQDVDMEYLPTKREGVMRLRVACTDRDRRFTTLALSASSSAAGRGTVEQGTADESWGNGAYGGCR